MSHRIYVGVVTDQVGGIVLLFSLLSQSHWNDLQLGSALAIQSRLVVFSSFPESSNQFIICTVTSHLNLLFSLLFTSHWIPYSSMREMEKRAQVVVFCSFRESLSLPRFRNYLSGENRIAVFSSFHESLNPAVEYYEAYKNIGVSVFSSFFESLNPARSIFLVNPLYTFFLSSLLFMSHWILLRMSVWSWNRNYSFSFLFSRVIESARWFKRQ